MNICGRILAILGWLWIPFALMAPFLSRYVIHESDWYLAFIAWIIIPMFAWLGLLIWRDTR